VAPLGAGHAKCDGKNAKRDGSPSRMQNTIQLSKNHASHDAKICG
jgi:hypothetical protein